MKNKEFRCNSLKYPIVALIGLYTFLFAFIGLYSGIDKAVFTLILILAISIPLLVYQLLSRPIKIEITEEGIKQTYRFKNHKFYELYAHSKMSGITQIDFVEGSALIRWDVIDDIKVYGGYVRFSIGGKILGVQLCKGARDYLLSHIQSSTRLKN